MFLCIILISRLYITKTLLYVEVVIEHLLHGPLCPVLTCLMPCSLFSLLCHYVTLLLLTSLPFSEVSIGLA